MTDQEILLAMLEALEGMANAKSRQEEEEWNQIFCWIDKASDDITIARENTYKKRLGRWIRFIGNDLVRPGSLPMRIIRWIKRCRV